MTNKVSKFPEATLSFLNLHETPTCTLHVMDSIITKHILWLQDRIIVVKYSEHHSSRVNGLHIPTGEFQ